MKNLIAVIAVLLGGCLDQKPAADCKQFVEAIDATLKLAASDYSEGFLDNSAPRETNRQLRLALAMSQINANIQLMSENKCPAISEPIDVAVYFAAAIECKGKLIGWREGMQRPAECAVAGWKKPK